MFEGFLLQVARASYINQVLTPPVCKLLNFLNFYFHYSLNKVPSFSGFLMCITIKMRNVAFWHK